MDKWPYLKLEYEKNDLGVLNPDLNGIEAQF